MYFLKELPFSYSQLEPYIDTHTMGLHYQKHQKNYLKELNTLLMKYQFDYSYPIEKLYEHLEQFPEFERSSLIFYLGGVLNHDLFWKSISPKNKELPSLGLMKKINEQFDSFCNFEKEFKNLAMKLKGSGYIFLVKTSNGKLELQTLSNQDSPYLSGDTPILCIDLWEHSYYLNYKNDKSKYIDTFLEIANYSFANAHFTE